VCTFLLKRDLEAGGPPHGQFCPPSNKNPENPIFERDNTQSIEVTFERLDSRK